MLATEILTTDHRQAMALINQLEDGAAGTGTFDQLKQALYLHMREEEEIFYPALVRLDEFSDLIEENVPEHEMVRAMLAQLGELEPSANVFQETLAEMKAALEMHMQNEEDNVFPDALKALGADEIKALGGQIDRMKTDSETRGRGASM